MGGHNIYIPKKITEGLGFGLLYNREAVLHAKNIAPSGWHVASEDEWNALVTYVGGQIGNANKLKEEGITHWLNDNGIDTYGFAAVGNGFRAVNGGFSNLKSSGIIRTSRYWGDYGRAFGFTDTSANINAPSVHKNEGYSVRLIKDNSINTGTMTGNDGKTYKTVKIDDQVWMAENLAETKYRDGTSIPEVTDNTDWYNLTTGALCAYNNDWNNV